MSSVSPSLVEAAARAALPVIEKLIGEHNGAIVARAQEWRDAGHISEDTRRAICALALLGDEAIPVEVMQHLQELHGGPVEDADSIRARIGDARLNRQPTAARAVADAVLEAVGDVLRLDGAQAERERAIATLQALPGEWRRTDKVLVAADEPLGAVRWVRAADVLAALGGVHPEAG